MFLINAIYFKGSWRAEFDPSLTVDAPFHGSAGDQPAKLMHREGTMRWRADADLQAVDLPYGNARLLDDRRAAERGQERGRAWPHRSRGRRGTAWTAQFSDAEVELASPAVQARVGAHAHPRPAGARHACRIRQMAARTSAGCRHRATQLFISLVKQKTYVDVNEEGTEAAAVTNVGISLTSAPVRRPFIVDRPFVFVMRERLSGTILFMGKIIRMP